MVLVPGLTLALPVPPAPTEIFVLPSLRETVEPETPPDTDMVALLPAQMVMVPEIVVDRTGLETLRTT